MNRIFANIKLPIDIFPNGEFKMLYDQMKLDVEMPNKNEELEKRIREMKEEMVENILENSNMEEREKTEEEDISEIKIYKSDYTSNRIKKRINTTFRKWIDKHKITKKNYISLETNNS